MENQNKTLKIREDAFAGKYEELNQYRMNLVLKSLNERIESLAASIELIEESRLSDIAEYFKGKRDALIYVLELLEIHWLEEEKGE